MLVFEETDGGHGGWGWGLGARERPRVRVGVRPSTCSSNKYLLRAYCALGTLPGLLIEPRGGTGGCRPGGEGGSVRACGRNPSEASQAGAEDPGGGNGTCLVGAGKRVWLGWGECGAAGHVGGGAGGEPVEGW